MATLATLIFWVAQLCFFIISQYAIYAVTPALLAKGPSQGMTGEALPEDAGEVPSRVETDSGAMPVQPMVQGYGRYSQVDEQQIVVNIIGGLIQLVLTWCYMCRYKVAVVDRIQQRYDGPIQPRDLFGCCEDNESCVKGWLCPLNRMAHSAHVTGVLDYWMTCLLLTCLPCCDLCVATWLRMQIKEKIGIIPSVVEDFCSMCCCGCCAIIQQGKEVDTRMQVRVRGCFDVEQAGSAATQMQGPAVQMMSRQMQGPAVQGPAVTGTQMQLMTIMCPEGVGPDRIVEVATPSGAMVRVAVPEGVQPGQNFGVNLPVGT
mmetsp:Transcript_125700/g.250859  ORF Transcript_125700/g.250859 Transcript_125700/m.250859 type:complete len:316 (+) Transcript_125700:91-1038(+)